MIAMVYTFAFYTSRSSFWIFWRVRREYHTGSIVPRKTILLLMYLLGGTVFIHRVHIQCPVSIEFYEPQSYRTSHCDATLWESSAGWSPSNLVVLAVPIPSLLYCALQAAASPYYTQYLFSNLKVKVKLANQTARTLNQQQNDIHHEATLIMLTRDHRRITISIANVDAHRGTPSSFPQPSRRGHSILM